MEKEEDNMRRADREVKEQTEIQKIMEQCKVCRIGMYDEGEVYIVPLNFGFQYIADAAGNVQYTIFVHSAGTGRKIELLTKNRKIGFELDTDHELVEADSPCAHSYRFASIIGTARAEFVEDPQGKIEGLQAIMRQQTGKEFAFQEAMVKGVTVIRLHVETLSCKRH